MSLRTRLTILYTILLVGILLLFGVAVSLFFNDRLKSQLDLDLSRAARVVIDNTHVDKDGQLVVSPEEINKNLPANTMAQLRGRDGQIYFTNTSVIAPLDPLGIRSQTTVYRDVVVGSIPVRSYSVPVKVGTRIVGVVQVGTSMNLVSDMQNILFTVTVVGMIIGTVVAALAVWFSTSQALASLSNATGVALQITKADDLSRRIPYDGPPEDEIGQLINAFNRTLSRLETLFNSQRRFLADVGHELRTPLTVIKGNTHLMRRMACGDEESLVSIESEVDRLSRLVGDLLLLAQAESGKLPLSNQLVELDTLTLEAMSQMGVLVHEGVKLRLAEIDQVLVCGDRDKLKQVLLNLIGNAINYTQAGEVVVGVGKSDNQARITVTDTGPGISPEDLPHVFERFYRAEKSRTRSKAKGFGLGLSIAYWIVRNHAGHIEVDSTLGKGTTFCIWLPLAQGDCQPKEQR